jgi:hypothetical protein
MQTNTVATLHVASQTSAVATRHVASQTDNPVLSDYDGEAVDIPSVETDIVSRYKAIASYAVPGRYNLRSASFHTVIPTFIKTQAPTKQLRGRKVHAIKTHA